MRPMVATKRAHRKNLAITSHNLKTVDMMRQAVRHKNFKLAYQPVLPAQTLVKLTVLRLWSEFSITSSKLYQRASSSLFSKRPTWATTLIVRRLKKTFKQFFCAKFAAVAKHVHAIHKLKSIETHSKLISRPRFQLGWKCYFENNWTFNDTVNKTRGGFHDQSATL